VNLIGNILTHLFVLLSGMGYKHKTINHSRGCGTAEGVNTKHVECLWRGAKRKWNPWMAQGVPFWSPIWTNGYGGANEAKII